MTKNNKILQDLKNYLLQNYEGSIRDVILFGSQSYGDFKENSDYDVLIILDEDYNSKDESNLLDLCYDIDLKYNIILDVHIISTNELSSIRGKQPIFVNAIKSGIYA